MGSLLRIALRNVLRNRRRSAVTLSAVFLAVAVVVGVRGFLNGLQSSLRDTIVRAATGAVQVHRRGFSAATQGASLELDFAVDEAFLARIAATPGVAAAAPRIGFGGMVNIGDQTAFAIIQAIDPAREPDVCPERNEMVTRGKVLDGKSPGVAMVTPELAEAIRVTVDGKGEPRAALLSNDRDGVLNAVEVPVGGLFEAALPLPDKKMAFVPLAAAQELLRMPGRATEVAVRVEPLGRAEEVAGRLRAALGPDYEVSTWREVAPFIDELVATQNLALDIVAGTFLFVALLGVANTMLMSVLERTREIGTMMAVGLRRVRIVRLFVLESALLGLTGGLLGAAAGVGFTLLAHAHGIDIRFSDSHGALHIRPFVDVRDIVVVFLLSAGGAMLAALYPAWRASRMRPVEALGAV